MPIVFTFQHLSQSAPKHACCVWGTTFHFLSSQSLCLQSKRTHRDTQVNRLTDFLWSFCFLNGICQGGRHIFSPWNSYIDWRWYPFCLEEFKSFSPVYIQFCQLCLGFQGAFILVPYLFWCLQMALHLIGLKSMVWTNWWLFSPRRTLWGNSWKRCVWVSFPIYRKNRSGNLDQLIDRAPAQHTRKTGCGGKGL